MLLTNNRN